MRLGGIDFRPVFCASGALNFDGHGYPYHKFWRWAGLTFEDYGFTAKTTTLEERLDPAKKKGHMPMKADGITPAEWKPKCIITNFFTGDVLNAVGLSGPGAPKLLKRRFWQERHGEPWFLSFMSVQPTLADRLAELQEFVQLLLTNGIHNWNAKVGLELNLSCPNVGLHIAHLVEEVCQALDIAAQLGIPIQCKFNALVPVAALMQIARHPACAALVIGNTIPWGTLDHLIPWARIFGTFTSPLAHLDGGGLSGPRLLPIHCGIITELRGSDCPKPIWGCGGINSVRAVKEYISAGTQGIQIGSTSITRPWRMRAIASYANDCLM